MAQPVWVLSVDLQTKTATFQSGMADAARSARGAFNEIKSGSSEMSGHVSTNMFASRHAIMAVSEAFGDTMPRAITALLVHIGPLGAALEAAFPFAAIALGAVLLIEHLAKMREAGVKLTEDQVRFGTEVQNAFNLLDQKLISAQIKSDELRNDHLGALHLQLKLIDEQSMDELVASFAKVAKGADVLFAQLKSSWYTFGIGSDGAKHALDEFQTKYDDLLAKGKDKEASDLLKGTRESAEKVLAAQQAATNLSGKKGTGTDEAWAAELEFRKANAALKANGVGYTEKEVKAQQALVDALQAQSTLETKVNALRTVDKKNANDTTEKELSALAAAGAKEAADHARKMGEMQLQIDKETAEAGLAMKEATISERLSVDLKMADAEYRVALEGNAALIAALDKGSKDYTNQLKALKDKELEITEQHAVTLATLNTKATVAQYRLDIANLEAGEKEKIAATDTGSRERLAAIDAAIKGEEARGLTATANYRDLLKQRVEAQRQYEGEASKLAVEAGREEAANAERMGELGIAAERAQTALRDSARRISAKQQMDEGLHFAAEEYALQLATMQREEAALDKGGKDYENKLRAIQNKEKQLSQQHENEIAAIKSAAVIDTNKRILAAATQFNDQIISGLTQVLMGHKSFASMMASMGDQVVSGMMQNAIKMMEANLLGKESDAARAARTAYNIGLSYGGPAGIVLGPVFAAAAFAGVSAYQDGTDMVPGVGRGDKVPAMLEPGEGVVPRGVMDNLRSMARSGTMGGGPVYQIKAHFAPVIHAVDATGVDRMLNKHGDKFRRHFEGVVRGMNR